MRLESGKHAMTQHVLAIFKIKINKNNIHDTLNIYICDSQCKSSNT